MFFMAGNWTRGQTNLDNVAVFRLGGGGEAHVLYGWK